MLVLVLILSHLSMTFLVTKCLGILVNRETTSSDTSMWSSGMWVVRISSENSKELETLYVLWKESLSMFATYLQRLYVGEVLFGTTGRRGRPLLCALG